MRLTRSLPVVLLALLAGPLAPPRTAAADDKVLGEATELTEKVRADALKLIDVVSKSTVEKDVIAARRGLLKLGPVVWPVIENALRLGPPEAARPHLNLLKAMLAKKTEPEFEALRGRLRKRMMMDDLKGMQAELASFRLGLPDPAKPGKRLPLSCKSTKVGSTTVYRSSDGALVVGYGGDADEKVPDALGTAGVSMARQVASPSTSGSVAVTQSTILGSPVVVVCSAGWSRATPESRTPMVTPRPSHVGLAPRKATAPMSRVGM